MTTASFQNADWLNTEAIVLGSGVIYASPSLVIYSLQNWSAAEFWSDGTSWCIRDPSWYRDYLDRGRLYIFRVASTKRRYLLSVGACEFRNGRNRQVSLAAFIERFPSAEIPIRRLLSGYASAQIHFKVINSWPSGVKPLEM